MVGDDADLLEEGQLVPDSESDNSDDEQNQQIVGCHIGVCYDLLPTRASEQGNVICLVSLYSI